MHHVNIRKPNSSHRYFVYFYLTSLLVECGSVSSAIKSCPLDASYIYKTAPVW